MVLWKLLEGRTYNTGERIIINDISVIVVDTGRFRRGVVTDQTEIVIIQDEPSTINTTEPDPLIMENNYQDNESEENDDTGTWEVLWEMAKIGEDWDGSLPSTISKISIEPLHISLARLMAPLLADALYTQLDLHDRDSTIYLSIDYFVKLGVIDGGYAILTYDNNDLKRIVRVRCLCTKQGSKVASLSPLLLQNIMIHTNSSLALEVDTLSEMCISPLMTSMHACIANNVILSRVASELSNLQSTIDTCLPKLQSYFSTSPRLVCKGDIVPIVLNESELLLQRYSVNPPNISTTSIHSSTSLSQYIVYFVVSDVTYSLNEKNIDLSEKYKTFLVDSAITRITQMGVTHTHITLHSAITSYMNIVPNRQIVDQHSMHLYDTLYNLFRVTLYQPHVNNMVTYWAPLVLLKGCTLIGKCTLIRTVAEDLGLNVCVIDCYQIATTIDSNERTNLIMRLTAAVTERLACLPVVIILRHVEALSTLSSMEHEEMSMSAGLKSLFIAVEQKTKELGTTAILTATSIDAEKISPTLRALFLRELNVQVPTERERQLMITKLIHNLYISLDVDIVKIARQTAGFAAGALECLVRRTRQLAHLNAFKQYKTVNGETMSADTLYKLGVNITADDFSAALGEAQTAQRDAIGAPKIPKVTWDDVGGLAHVKRDILDTIQLPLQHPELFASGMKKRSGILFYGPPGTGKTLLAKAVATSCSLNFLSVKGPELLNMYIGESERNVREIFQRARDARPCVIFFDELDSVAPKRGEKSDAGGVMDRIVSQLLAELDGMSSGGTNTSSADSSTVLGGSTAITGEGEVFVIGATNRPDLLDEALLRPGRFDKLIYLGVAQDYDSQITILKALTRKFNLASDIDFMEIVNQCSFNYTGADFYALCSDAMLKAMSRTIKSVERRVAALNEQESGDHEINENSQLNVVTETSLVESSDILRQQGRPDPLTVTYYLEHEASLEDTYVIVTQQDFKEALVDLVPSVSVEEMASYLSAQAKFSPPSASTTTIPSRSKYLSRAELKGKGKQ